MGTILLLIKKNISLSIRAHVQESINSKVPKNRQLMFYIKISEVNHSSKYLFWSW
jgi:hypothetical protein